MKGKTISILSIILGVLLTGCSSPNKEAITLYEDTLNHMNTSVNYFKTEEKVYAYDVHTTTLYSEQVRDQNAKICAIHHIQEEPNKIVIGQSVIDGKDIHVVSTDSNTNVSTYEFQKADDKTNDTPFFVSIFDTYKEANLKTKIETNKDTKIVHFTFTNNKGDNTMPPKTTYIITIKDSYIIEKQELLYLQDDTLSKKTVSTYSAFNALTSIDVLPLIEKLQQYKTQ